MFRFLQRKSRSREIYFHEDDYCQQQLLPRGLAAQAVAELKKIREFADAHRIPDGLGWTDMYVRQEAPAEIGALKMKKDDFAAVVSPFLPAYDVVYTGYSSHREQCKKTAAWGTSPQCALFADWDDDFTVASVWAELFDRNEDSIRLASKAVAALGKAHPLIYVDWAWGYTCDASDMETFASLLRTKLQTIAENVKKGEP